MRVDIEKIKDFKKEKNLTNRSLAKLANIKRNQYEAIVYQCHMPKADILSKIAFALDCWVEDLLIAEEGDYAS